MGKASRAKREAREGLPEKFTFGPEFTEPEVRIGVGLASAQGGAMVSGPAEPTEEEAE
jgi:hypothetical protein